MSVPTTSDREARLARVSMLTAAGTLASRATGLIRLVVLVYALGGGHVADAFNLANNTPNMVHDLVLGGVLAATFVPVFVESLQRRSLAEAEKSISAVLTMALVLLVVTTVIFELAAPAIVDAYTFGHATSDERALAVELLRFFAPQLFFYGLVSLMAAVLAARDRFIAVGIVPVLNNLVSIVVLALFAAVARSTTTGAVLSDHTLIYLLGIGTTAGVVVQALALVPSMRRCGISLRLVWRPRDPALSRIVSLSGWTLLFVAANQLAVFVVLILEFHVGTGAVSAYTYAYTFFQFPFGVVATAVINVASPDLARAHALGDLALLARRFARAVRRVLAFILPSVVGYLLLARPALHLVLLYGAETQADVASTARVLMLFSLGLPGFCVFFLAVRTFQAMQDTRTAFVLYTLENATNILIAVLTYRSLGVDGLALSYSVAYSVAAVVALLVLRERLGSIGGRFIVTSSLRSLACSLAMALGIAVVTALLSSSRGLVGWIDLFVAVGVGIGVYFSFAGVAGSLAGWQTSRRREAAPRDTRARREHRGSDRDRH